MGKTKKKTTKKQYKSPEFLSLTIDQFIRIANITAVVYEAETDKGEETVSLDFDRQG